LVPSRRLRVVGTVIVVANLALFVCIAEDLFDGGGLVSHDKAVLNWFLDHRTETMIRAAKFIGTFAGFVSLMCVGIALGLWLWRRDLLLAIAPLASLLVAGIASAVSKVVFGRERPPIEVRSIHISSPAFPSGHATDAAAFFLAAAFVLAIVVAKRRWARVVLIGTAIALAGMVGISRLVLAVHWLSDVVAGWALGTAIAITTVLSLWRAPRSP
jgi:undecaprenyl-diphosphatase